MCLMNCVNGNSSHESRSPVAKKMMAISFGLGYLLLVGSVGLLAVSLAPRLLKAIKQSSLASLINQQADVIRAIALSTFAMGAGLSFAGYYGYKKSLLLEGI